MRGQGSVELSSQVLPQAQLPQRSRSTLRLLVGTLFDLFPVIVAALTGGVLVALTVQPLMVTTVDRPIRDRATSPASEISSHGARDPSPLQGALSQGPRRPIGSPQEGAQKPDGLAGRGSLATSGATATIPPVTAPLPAEATPLTALPAVAAPNRGAQLPAEDEAGLVALSAADAGMQRSTADTGSPVEVARWSLSNNGRSRRLLLTLDGSEAAIDRLRGGGRLLIQAHWVREGPRSVTPDLVTEIPVGRPDLVGTFEQQVRQTGFFEWHTSAEKRALSPGAWSVSLTYPDGQPVLCKPKRTSCRLSFTVG
jgi:hypothetical protein